MNAFRERTHGSLLRHSKAMFLANDIPYAIALVRFQLALALANQILYRCKVLSVHLPVLPKLISI
jgi:hypothetical protein